MLTMMREMLRSKFAGLLFGLIIVSMAVWGVTDIFSGGIGANLAKAGDRAVSVEQLDRRLEAYLRNAQQQGGDIVTREDAVGAGVVDQLFGLEASRTANLGYASATGAEASVKGVTNSLREIEAFQSELTGEFDLETYRNRLARAQLSPAQFEQDLRDDLTLDILGEAAAGAVSVPTILGRMQASYLGEFRTISWVTVPRSALPEVEEPDEAAVRAFYEEQIDAFREPERRIVDILSLSTEDFLHQVDIPESDVETFYEATKTTRFAGPQTRVFTEVAFANEASAREALGLIAGGTDPSTLTAPINVNRREAMKTDMADAELAEQLFSLGAQTGSVFGPNQSGDVWLITRIDDIIPGEPNAFEDVADLIRSEMTAQQAERLYFDAMNKIDDLIGIGMSLEDMGAELGAPLLSFDAVDERGITSNGAVLSGFIRTEGLLDAVFGLAEGERTERFDLDASTLIARLKSIEAASTPEFETVSDRARTALLARQRANALERAGEGIKQRIDAGTSTLDAEAETLGLTVQRPDQGISRRAYDVGLPAMAVNAVFAGDEGDIVTVPGNTASEVVVVKIEEIERPDEDELNILAPSAAASLEPSLADDLGEAFEMAVRAETKFEADASAFERYKAGLTRQQ